MLFEDFHWAEEQLLDLLERFREVAGRFCSSPRRDRSSLDSGRAGVPVRSGSML